MFLQATGADTRLLLITLYSEQLEELFLISFFSVILDTTVVKNLSPMF